MSTAGGPSYGSSVDNAETIADSTAKVTLKRGDRPGSMEAGRAVARHRPGCGPVHRRRAPRGGPDLDRPAAGDERVHRRGPRRRRLGDGPVRLLRSRRRVLLSRRPAHLLQMESRRGLFTTATNAVDVPTTAGTYRVNVTPDDPVENLAMLLSAALQRQLADLEVIVAANARTALTGHGVDEATDLLVIDGPLRGTHPPAARAGVHQVPPHRLPAP